MAHREGCVEAEEFRAPLHNLEDAVHRREDRAVVEEWDTVEHDDPALAVGVVDAFHDLPGGVEEPVEAFEFEGA